jgi:sigma-B regulation protein RsbU (phosphoserine phosphatase)
MTPFEIELFLLDLADVANSTLELDELLKRIALAVRRIIDFHIFSILLLDERTQTLRIRFAVGYPPEVVETLRIKLGQGVTGLAAQRGEAVLVNDVTGNSQYIEGAPGVHSELAVPLITKNHVTGVIDIEAPQQGYFSEEHKRILMLVASRVAMAVENARLYTRVSRQARILALLNEISRELTSILNLDELLKRIGELLKRLMDYQMFGVLLLDENGEKLQHRFSLRYNESIQIKHDIPVGEGLVGYAARMKEPVLVQDVSVDPRYINLNPETRSELSVPLIYKEKVIGVLDIEHTQLGYFNENHVSTMTTLAAQVAIAIENARLYEAVQRQEQQLERDLALARELQVRLLPSCCPLVANAQLAAKFVPARFIGGDLYDFLQYPSPAKWGIAIGDVSGKGAPAALYAALVSGYLRSRAALSPGPAKMMAGINTSLYGRRIDAQYVSMIYATWDGERRQLRIANSGLPRPVYCKQGKVERIDAAGLPMGLFAEATYDELTFDPEPGDVFVFFSDGMTDAADANGQMFGREALENVIARNWDKTAEQLLDALFEAVTVHAAGAIPFDDQTVVVLKVK